jgi:head-tail adaptor
VEVDPVRSGLLDRRIVLQRRGQNYSDTGEPVETWTEVATRWASLDPLTGFERSTDAQWVAREQVKFVVRWSPELDTLSPLDRVVDPYTDASVSPVPPRSIYDIMSVLEQGRRQSLIVMAARRVA